MGHGSWFMESGFAALDAEDGRLEIGDSACFTRARPLHGSFPSRAFLKSEVALKSAGRIEISALGSDFRKARGP